MLQFSKDYFLGETISGHYVKPVIKRRWAAMLEVLAEFDSVCKKYGITYFADWGTLLGAIRHKGFIPWDDDMDLAMKREDFRKFQKIAPLEFNYFEAREGARDIDGRLYYHSLDISKKAFAQQIIITNSRQISFENDFLRRYHGCPFATAIDVFPLDYFPEEDEQVTACRQVLEILCDLMDHSGHWDDEGNPSEYTVLRELKDAGALVGYHSFDESGNLRLQAARLFDALSSIYEKDESNFLEHSYWDSRSDTGRRHFPKEWYNDNRYVPFENTEISIPAEYDKVLTLMFGDYMTPVVFEDHGDIQMDMLREMDPFKGRDVEEVLEEISQEYD